MIKSSYRCFFGFHSIADSVHNFKKNIKMENEKLIKNSQETKNQWTKKKKIIIFILLFSILLILVLSLSIGIKIHSKNNNNSNPPIPISLLNRLILREGFKIEYFINPEMTNDPSSI